MRSVLAITVLSMALAACGSDDAATTTSLPEPARATAASTTTTTQIAAVSDSPFLAALEATLAEQRYNFGGEFIVTQAGTPLPIRLNGWVDGENRLVNASTEAGSVITKVIDGTASSIKDNVETAIPIEEAGEAPSLAILRSLDVSTDTEGSVAGVLPASLLAEANGVSAEGFVDVTVWYTDRIVAYRLSARDGSWALEMTFSPFEG